MIGEHFATASSAGQAGTVHVIATSLEGTREVTRLGCHVTFVHVPRGEFVSPLVAVARDRVPQARRAQDNQRSGR